MTNTVGTLAIRSSPHLTQATSTDRIMLHVVLALMPVTSFAVYQFGLAALLVLTTAVASCVGTEHLLCRVTSRPTTVRDWSAVITGVLLGLVLPPGLPLWMVAMGGFISVGLGKFIFGGLGCNPFNPALVGRAILQASFPLAMTTWTEPASRFAAVPASTLAAPFLKPTYDGVSAATPLSDWKFSHSGTNATDLFLGSVAGSTGETSAILILLGGGYLILRRMMSWQIPVAILGTVAIASWLLSQIDPSRFAGPTFMLCSGGLMLGAVFMATDMVASPLTHWGCVLYGVLIGGLVVLIRVWGGMPEGVMYAILLGNAASPLIDRAIGPRVFGSHAAGASP